MYSDLSCIEPKTVLSSYEEHCCGFYLPYFGKCNSILGIDGWIDSTYPKTQTTSRGDAFEAFAILYFFCDESWSHKTQHVYTTSKKLFGQQLPFSLAEKLGIHEDKGIDLILECKERLELVYYTVQVKWRNDPTTKLKWGEELSTFDASAGRTMIHNPDLVSANILFTNTWDVPKEYKEDSHYLVISRGDLLDSELCFTILKHLANNIDPTDVGKTLRSLPPRPYQENAIAFFESHYAENSRGSLILPCGSGKTYTSIKITEKITSLFKNADCPTIWIILPTLDIVSQHYRSFMRFYPTYEGQPWNCLFVSSDVAEKKRAGSRTFIVSTKHEEWKGWMSKCKGVPRILFSTYASADKLWKFLHEEKITIDFCTVDEAHRTAGNKKKQMGNVIRKDNPYIHRYLFLTATPKIVKVIKGDMDMVHCMSDETIYGPSYSVSYRDLVNKGYLSDYTVELFLDSTVEYNPDEYVIEGKEKRSVASSDLATLALIRDKFQNKKIHHCLAYSNANKDAQTLEIIAKSLFKDMEIKVFRVNGEMSANTRNRIFDEYQKSEKAIIFNAKLLREAIDFPITDAIAICCTMKSTIDIVQTVLRADRLIRNDEGEVIQDHFQILLPCIIKDEEKFVNETGDFETVRRVISALAEEDCELKEEWLMEYGYGDKKKYRGKRRIKINCGKILKRVDDTEKWIGHFTIQSFCSEKIRSVQWYKRLREVVEYVEKEGEIPLTTQKPLGRWCDTQRQNYKKGKLSSERIAALESIEGWYWEIDLDKLWEENRQKVIAYKKKEGEFPPQKQGPLGIWCNRKRQNYKKGKLSSERIAALESIEGWYWEIDMDKVWEENLQQVMAYKKKESKFPPRSQGSLGTWCDTQRQNYKKGKLSSERIAALESIEGWYWEIDMDEFWEENRQKIIAYVEQEGEIPSFSQGPLGRWCKTQRQNYKKGKLSPERIAALESIKGWYWEIDMDEFWEENRQKVMAYKKKEGEIPSYSQGSLGRWCDTQRQNYKKGKLSSERIAALESIEGWYWEIDLDKLWEENRQKVIAYKKKEGEFPPQKQGPLGIWCSTQRKNYKKGKLSSERIAALESIEGWYWEIDMDEFWEENLQQVIAYKKKEGEFPPQKQGSLGTWCNQQRQNYKKGKLSPERIAALESIEGWYWSKYSKK